jgi:multidrug efflux pump subunit AcrA (membrane-fusion protein)
MPNKAFTGTVKFISPFGVKTGQVVKFAVTIELEASDAPLRGGLSATADIMVASVKNALLVPVSAVLSTPAGNVVSVIDPATGQAERRQVTIGIQNLQYAEVLSGLKEGDKVQVSQKGSGSAATGQPRPGAGAANPMRVLR